MLRGRTSQLSVIVLLATLLFSSGCGYQLRGNVALPDGISRVFIAGGDRVLRDEVETILSTSGATVLEDKDDADAVLRLFDEARTERLLGVDPDTGTAREFELAYSVRFWLRDKTGNPIVPTQQLRVVRDYVFDRDALIGNSRERGVLQREMQRDAALQLVRRLSNVGG